MFSLTGKKALVTGGCSGIGLAVVKRFLSAGAKVMVVDLQTTAEFEELSTPFIELDVSDEKRLCSAFSETETQIGKLDILINNAGIALDTGPITDTDLEQYERYQAVNLKGVFLGMKYGPRHMNDGGSIINTASIAAHMVYPEYTSYSVTKAGVVSLTTNAAVELSSRNIRVNAVCPGTTITPLDPADSDEFRVCELVTCAGRAALPEEQAAVYHFLASDDSKYINAQAINVDGGWVHGLTYRAMEKLVG